MKLYQSKLSPYARRVRMFLAEKGITLAMEECWDSQANGLQRDYLERYAFRLIPMLELDDGTQIGESTAICRYFEELYPEPNLFGRDPLEKAVIEMWHQRANADGEIGAEEAFRNAFPAMHDRGLAGTVERVPQIPALVERGKARFMRCMWKIDEQLVTQEFIAGARFTMVDITAICAIDFAKFASIEMPSSLKNLERWRREVARRPSASA